MDTLGNLTQCLVILTLIIIICHPKNPIVCGAALVFSFYRPGPGTSLFPQSSWRQCPGRAELTSRRGSCRQTTLFSINMMDDLPDPVHSSCKLLLLAVQAIWIRTGPQDCFLKCNFEHKNGSMALENNYQMGTMNF